MSKERVALAGGIASVFAKGIGFISQLLALAIVAERFSLSQLGLFTVLTSFLLIYDLFDFGITSAGLRYSLAARSDSGENLFFASVTLSILIYGSLLVGLLFLPGSWAIALLFILLRAPFLAVRHALCAEQKVHKRALLEGLENLLVAGVVVFFRGPFNVLIALYFGALFLFALLTFSLFIRGRGWRFRLLSWKDSYFYLRPLLRFSFFSWGQNLCLLLIVGSQPLLLSICCSLEEVGRVALLYKIFAMLFGVHYALLNPFLSLFTQADARGERAWMTRIVRRFKRGFFPLFGLAIGGLFVSYSQLIFWWKGEQVSSPKLFFALGIFAFSYMWGALFSTFLNGIARVERQLKFLGIGVVVHFLLSPYLASLWGAPGFFVGEAVALLPFAFSNQREVKQCIC